MGNHIINAVPERDLPLVDCHCHIPYSRVSKNIPKSYEEQYQEFMRNGGKFLITSSVDLETLEIMLEFSLNHEKCYLSSGFAPQTITYTKSHELERDYSKWQTFLHENQDKYVSIGEIGLDFHHAKTLQKRTEQIKYFNQILEDTRDLNKPYVLHVRNPSTNDVDREHPTHSFNKFDAANTEIIKLLQKNHINPRQVMWHCFAGPKEWGIKLANKGFMLSVITSGFRDKRMRSYTEEVPISQLLTETDSYWQHPLEFKGFNIPLNVKYSITAIAYTHNLPQYQVAHQVLENAKNFFSIL